MSQVRIDPGGNAKRLAKARRILIGAALTSLLWTVVPATAAAKQAPAASTRLIPVLAGQTPLSLDGAGSNAHALYWGAYVGDQFTGGHPPWDWSAETAFELFDAGGKPASLLPFGAPFHSTVWCGGACTFPPDVFSKVRQNGMIPWFSWQTTSAYTDAQIAAGAEDPYIAAWARAARAWGHPFFLRFDWEMDGNWFPWGMGVHGNTPSSYVAMWRHVHDIFTSVRASNVTWVWCPNVYEPGDTFRPLSSLYPGNGYVDWSCLDGYNRSAPWTSFRNLFGSDYRTIINRVAPGKPLAIGETGSTEAGGSKPGWIAGMFASLPREFGHARALLWYDIASRGPGGQSDWPIETTPGSRVAFQRGIAGPGFADDSYQALSGHPIGPPASVR